MGNNSFPQQLKVEPKSIQILYNQSANKNNKQQAKNFQINQEKQIKNNLYTDLQNLETKQNIKSQVRLSDIDFTPTAVLIRRTSPNKQCQLIRSSMMKSNYIVTNDQKLNQMSLEAPFSVIFLTCSEQLRKSLQILQSQVLQKYMNKHHNCSAPWKLHPKGYYINFIAENLIGVVTHDKFFQGNITFIEDQILPSGKGIFVNQKGKYSGQFLNGKANGTGTFIDRISETKFSGQWIKGQFVKGKVENRYYIFDGFFLQNMANGDGSIKFKNNNIFYKGSFKDGLYDTIGMGLSYYQCQNYVYKGEFEKGKKHNRGILADKLCDYKDKKLKYRSLERYEGLWEKDCFIQNKNSNQKFINFRVKKQNQRKKDQSQFLPKKDNIKLKSKSSGSFKFNTLKQIFHQELNMLQKPKTNKAIK